MAPLLGLQFSSAVANACFFANLHAQLKDAVLAAHQTIHSPNVGLTLESGSDPEYRDHPKYPPHNMAINRLYDCHISDLRDIPYNHPARGAYSVIPGYNLELKAPISALHHHRVRAVAGNVSSEWALHYLRLCQQAGAGMGFVVRLNFLLSDGIVVWRTWVLFPFDKLVKFTLVFCMLVASVCTCVDGAITASRTAFDILHSVGGPATRNLLMSLPLLFTNVLATGLIGYKAWSHRKAVKQNLLSTKTTMSKALKTLWLMIESGLVYCIIWMAYIIVIETGPNSNDALATAPASIFISIIPLLAALFPALVILVTALEDNKESSNRSRILSQSIQFASRNTATSATGISTARSNIFLEAELSQDIILTPHSTADAMEHPTKNNL
ncbi:hypothetical protein K435DRAFT_867129 [Dendrothele bispora CBS 962.96]|uniref:Uncharacterized protein n=1 Tax=Dendrothele bispora (strain CBS 962.96) TaxID=1314807 RepID=A0A4S8LF78_DENBC|nr:hypothetical protein K435DRAFT_867129 [Dendrothele bispora CBS 962.96]